MKWNLIINYLLIQNVVQNISYLLFQNVNIFVDYFYFSSYRMKVSHWKVKVWASQRPRRKLVWKYEWILVPAAVYKRTRVCAHTHTHTKEAQHLEKAYELLTASSNQSINDECQHFGNIIAAKLRNYDMLWCAIQNDIVGIFLSVNRRILWTLSS